MKPATRHKQTIAGIEVETFPTTYRGKYVRGHRAYHQMYRRCVVAYAGYEFVYRDGSTSTIHRVGRKP